MNNVEILFAKDGINRNGIILYPKKTALEFIKQCKKVHMRLLGIDGFFISNDKTEPTLENSIDYSYLHIQEDIYVNAINFINTKSDNLYFEIITE